MKRKGFTYVEIMIASAIFLTMMVFIIKLDTTASRNIRAYNERVRMYQIAERELELYKSLQANSTGKTVEGYHVVITSTDFSSLVKEVTVSVRKTPAAPESEAVILKSHVLRS